ncbi:MAG: molybdopterin-dependent oxidoreductase [Alphaproteobacteria bacterium]|nr:molybdopterin-dependent oxidoreductase [Alphaproteobacteria bacterium]
MTAVQQFNTTRRAFLGGAGGFVVAVTLPVRLRAQGGAPGDAPRPFDPNAFVHVGADDIVTVLVKHIEFGQGPWTGLATLVAEELDADWSKVRAEHAPSDPKLYGDPGFGVQITGGSASIRTSYDLMRKAGAAARGMLVAAAARAWNAPASDIRVENGMLIYGDKSASFGSFADAAAKEAAPQDPPLKAPADFRYIGNPDLPKLDTAAKSTGAAMFTLDVYRDGMLTAVVRHADKFGAKVAGFDADAARAVPGVVDVRQIGSGVAVFGRNTYAALQGRKVLKVTWDESRAETRSSEQIATDWLAASRERGAVAHAQGDVDAALAAAATTLDADYVFPFLAHAPMEPLDAVIAPAEGGGVEVWLGSQSVTIDHQTIADACGIGMDKVKLNIMLAGGSFGRRAQPVSDFAREAAEAFMAVGGDKPVKLMWTREDDIRGGFYRPLSGHRLRGGLDADGRIVAWEHVVVGQSFATDTPFESMLIQDGVDGGLVEGASEIPYAVPNINVSNHIMRGPVPVLWWRSVGHTHTGYVVETFIDELLEKAGKDAVEGRLALMSQKNPRLAGTLRKAAEMADWRAARPADRALGVASVQSFGSYVTQVAEVSMADGAPKVHKVWCAVDCGIAVNPDIIAAQMEGGIGYGLSAILFNELQLGQGGAIMQSNFHDYRSLKLHEMPEVDVAIIKSDAAPTGVGEPGLPPIGPAVANAVRKLTGEPVRRPPFVRSMTA